MTRTWREGEAWLAADGAPAGPSIDVVIPSSRKGHGPYRITRDRGVILHQPPCEAWQHGHMRCRHVAEACYRSEQPGAAFYDEVRRLLSESAWWASAEDARSLVAAIMRAADTCRDQQEANASRAAYIAEGPDRDWSDLIHPDDRVKA